MSLSVSKSKKLGFVDTFVLVKNLISRETHKITSPKGWELVEMNLYIF